MTPPSSWHSRENPRSSSNTVVAEDRKEQEDLDFYSKKPHQLDGGYNTLVLDPLVALDSDLLWRVSKGEDSERREKHISDWIIEAQLSTILGNAAGIAPHVKRTYSSGTWLTDVKHRVAQLLERFPGDLFTAFEQANCSKTQLCPATSKTFGEQVGHRLLGRCCQLGALRMFHGDAKPENVLVRVAENSLDLMELKLIDFDPQFLFIDDGTTLHQLRYLWSIDEKEKQDYVTALFALLNIILFWQWFEAQRAKNHPFTESMKACHLVLKLALEHSEFPLDFMAGLLPAALTHCLNKWMKNYNGPLQRPHWYSMATGTFSSLNIKHFSWKRGPSVHGAHMVSAHGACCGLPCGFQEKNVHRELLQTVAKAHQTRARPLRLRCLAAGGGGQRRNHRGGGGGWSAG